MLVNKSPREKLLDLIARERKTIERGRESGREREGGGENER